MIHKDCCQENCNRCWMSISLRTILLGEGLSALILLGVMHLALLWNKMPFDRGTGLLILTAIVMARGYYVAARIVTFLDLPNSVTLNIMILLILTFIPFLPEILFIVKGKRRVAVRPFLVPNLDISPTAIAAEVGALGVPAKVRDERSLIVCLPEEVGVNIEERSIRIEGCEPIHICIFDDALALAIKILQTITGG